MDYKTIEHAMIGNPTSLFRELIKYDKDSLTNLIFQMGYSDCYIRSFVSTHKKKYNEDSSAQAIVHDFLSFCIELGYTPMRQSVYNPFLKEWGINTETSDKFCELPALWFDLADDNKCLLLNHIGENQTHEVVSQGFHLLHQAFKHKDYKTVELLAQFNVDFNQKDNWGKTPRDYAQNDPKGLDLYLKLNNTINEDTKFKDLKDWFKENIKDIGKYKYEKEDKIKKIQFWINSKWDSFSLEQKQEVFSLSIGSSTKDVFTFVGKKEIDKKVLVNPNYPFWLGLDNCTVKQLALNSIKNVQLDAYHEKNDVYFLEKLANLFENLKVNEYYAMKNSHHGSHLKEEELHLVYLAQKYFQYKDIWIKEVNEEPLLHILAKRKNNVFEVFGENWLNIKSPTSLVSCDSTFLLDEDKQYVIDRHDKGSISSIKVLKIPVQEARITKNELMKKTWLFKDKDGKYTFEYFLKNHPKTIEKFIPIIYEEILTHTDEFYKYSGVKTLSAEQNNKLSQKYNNVIQKEYPIDVIFKLLKSSLEAFEQVSYISYMSNRDKIVKVARACHNILSLDEHKGLYDYSEIKVPYKLKDEDMELSQDLSALVLNSKLNSNLTKKEPVKKLKI